MRRHIFFLLLPLTFVGCAVSMPSPVQQQQAPYTKSESSVGSIDYSASKRIKGFTKKDGQVLLICDDNSLVSMHGNVRFKNGTVFQESGSVKTANFTLQLEEGQAVNAEGKTYDAATLNLGKVMSGNCDARPLSPDPIVEATTVKLTDLRKKYPTLGESLAKAIEKMSPTYQVSGEDKAFTVVTVTGSDGHDIFYISDNEYNYSYPVNKIDATHQGITRYAIYRLDPVANTIKLLSKITRKNEVMFLYGRDGDKLIFTLMGYMDSPGPCFSVWTKAEFYSQSPLIQFLLITRPSGLQPYRLLPARLDAEQEKQMDCDVQMQQ